MRASVRQWSLWLVVFMGLGFLLFQVRFQNSPRDSKEVFFTGGKIMMGEPVHLEQDDPHIIEYIWSHGHLESQSQEPYNLQDPNIDPSRGQGQMIRKLLKNQREGFFVECGALDGEIRSNTLYMEKNLGWKGLLVEGDPSNYAKMKKKHRKAWMSNTCLAVKPYPHHVNFLQQFNTGKIMDDTGTKRTKGTVQVLCMPLFSLLSALNVTTVDYFSLDVEGNELQVLKTIPFEKIFIKTLSVEYIHTPEGKEEILEFMRSKGYRFKGEVHYPSNLANDVILVHESVDL